MAVVAPTKLEFNDDILYVEYESFSSGFDINKSLDKVFYVEYKSFSSDPIVTDLLFEPRTSEFVESETFVPMIADLDQTPVPVELS